MVDEAVRIGAVSYLNTKPLVEGLEELLPNAQLSFDLPSRLADQLTDGVLDVALIPSIEFFRGAGYSIVPDACIATRGEVWSVRVLFRKPPSEVASLALDEGSRTSAALTRIMLHERYGLSPQLIPLRMNQRWEESPADAVLIIGDRAMNPNLRGWYETWDIGEEWTRWTGLPCVFAMWVARPGFHDSAVQWALNAARDRGLQLSDAIAQREAAHYGLSTALCRRYFRQHLHYHLGDLERAGLERFYSAAVELGLAPAGRHPFRYADTVI